MSARMSLPTRPSARTAKRGNPLASASSFTHAGQASDPALDKGFFGADLLLRIQAEDTDRHWLIPERNGLVYAGTLSAMATVTVCCK